jgi:fructose-1,6-bisphosphatase/inositol monophosphatase family enzyme
MLLANSMSAHLEALFQAVLHAVTSGSADQWGKLGQNAKGDQVKWFDLAADRAVCTYLEQHFPCPVKLLSEEGEPRNFGVGEPEWTMILDPVDGSENFARGLAPTATAIALIPAGQPVAIDTVEYALVGDLYTGRVWQAARGQGGTVDGQLLHPRAATQIEQAFISCDLNHVLIQPSLARLLAQARAVRAFGSATLVLARVADGSLDAHLDWRNDLTPENFIAPALLITEMGGLITDPFGQPLPPIRSLTDCYSILAATTPELHAALRQQLQTED